MSTKKQREQAVIRAARQAFSYKLDTETGEQWLQDAICTWMIAPLADAIRRLDTFPPYGDGRKAPGLR